MAGPLVPAQAMAGTKGAGRKGCFLLVSIDLLLADDSTKHALGKVKDIMVELHMTFVPVDFIVMDMGSNTSSPIILGRPFLRTTGAVIDTKEGNVKFQFPHKKCMEHFPRKKEAIKVEYPHEFYPS